MAETSRPDSSGLGVTKEFYERMASTWGPDGIYGAPTDQALCYADGSGTRRAWIRSGRGGILRGFDWGSGAVGAAPIPIDLPANTSGLTRRDWLVLRLTRSSDWPVRAGFVQGQPGSSTMPGLNQGLGLAGVFEMPIGVATVVNGATSLSGGDVVRAEWYIGSGGGGIQCTAATMPPYVMPGVVLNQVDTGRVFVGAKNGGTLDWRQVSEVDTTATIDTVPQFTATVNEIRRRDRVVYVTLAMRRTDAAVAPGTTPTVGTIPDGFRPAAANRSPVLGVTSNAMAVCTVNTNGTVTIGTGPSVGIAQNSTFFVAASYPAA